VHINAARAFIFPTSYCDTEWVDRITPCCPPACGDVPIVPSVYCMYHSLHLYYLYFSSKRCKLLGYRSKEYCALGHVFPRKRHPMDIPGIHERKKMCSFDTDMHVSWASASQEAWWQRSGPAQEECQLHRIMFSISFSNNGRTY